MSRRILFLFVCLLLALLALGQLAPARPAAAQEAGDTCPAFVTTALQNVGTSCEGLGRNEACYGHDRVEVTFWPESSQFVFAEAADRAGVDALQTLRTAALDLETNQWGVAVLHLQANLPDTLPGQAVTVLLMGDASLQNAVQPVASPPPAGSVLASSSNTANIRTEPATTAAIVDNIPANTPLTVLGTNDVRNWFEVGLPSGGYGWIWGELVNGIGEVDLYGLPVTAGLVPNVQRYAPMQALYFDTAFGDLRCNEAPNAMVVQAPQDQTVTMRINDLDVQFGSTAVFMMAQLPDTSERIMVAALVEGEMSALVGGVRAMVNQPGQAFAVTVNPQGRVDSTSRIVLAPAEVAASAVQNACQDGVSSGLLSSDLGASACATTVAFYNPPAPTPVPVVVVPTAVPQQPQEPQATTDPNQPQPTAAPTEVAAANPAPVVSGSVSGNFEVGAHVANLGGATSLLSRAGMRWVKYQVRYDFGGNPASQAGLIGEAHASGFKILLGVVGDPGQLGGTPEDQYFADYARFVGGLAGLGADAIEVWNEMNIDREWPTGRIDPAMYVRMLAPAYNAIKGANSGTLVITGALAPTGAEGAFGLERVWNDDRYYAGMAAAGAAQYADCIGAHYNEGIVPPDQVGNDPRGDSYPTRFLTTMTDRAWAPFGGQRQICYTELGYLTPEGYGQLPSGFAWAQNVTLAQQAAWLANAAVINSSSGKVRLMIVWNLNFTNWGADPMAGYAMLRPDGSCPACDTLGQVTQ